VTERARDDPADLAEVDEPALAVRFRAQLSEQARRSGIVAGPLAVGLMLAWTWFDRLLEPGRAGPFLRVRAIASVPMGLAWLLLLTGRAKGRAAEVAVFGLIVPIQVAIAWMLPQVESSVPSYVLGFTLAIWSAALFVVWPWHWSLAVWAVSLLALAVGGGTPAHPMSAAHAGLALMYVGTAGCLATCGHYLRHQGAWQEFKARCEAERALCLAEERRAQVASLVHRLELLSQQDPLTGLANRRVFDQVLDREISRVLRCGGRIGLVLLDIDHFKRLNDTRGHQVGDAVLQQVAGALRRSARPDDVVARYGGEEFAVILLDGAVPEMEAAAERLRRCAAGAPGGGRATDAAADVTLSAGVAALPDDASSSSELVRAADAALYRAKATGRDRTVTARDERPRAITRR
jgi:diguanylate cyclase (GGDEF)-like protein